MARRTMLLTILLVVVGCGASNQLGSTEATSGPTTTEATPSTRQVDDQTETTDNSDVGAYLAGLANLNADLHDRLSAFEQEYNEAFWGVGFDEFKEPGDESEPPDPPSDEEMLEYLSGYWQGRFEEVSIHVERLSQLIPPPGFETVHAGYVAAYKDWADWMSAQLASFTSLDEYEALLTPLLGGTMDGLPAELVDIYDAFVTTCRAVEEAGRDAGFSSDIGCPTLPAEAVLLAVTLDSSWSAVPNPVSVGDGLVKITITNNGPQAVIPVVLDVWEGDPLALPVVDGVVDLNRSGVFEAGSEYASFGVAFIADVELSEGGLIGDPTPLLPGETIEVEVWSDGTLVIFDYTTGAFESGSFVVVDRSH